jgi:hypothetical protein
MARLAIRSVCSAAPGIFGAAIRKDDILGSNHRRRHTTKESTFTTGAANCTPTGIGSRRIGNLIHAYSRCRKSVREWQYGKSPPIIRFCISWAGRAAAASGSTGDDAPPVGHATLPAAAAGPMPVRFALCVVNLWSRATDGPVTRRHDVGPWFWCWACSCLLATRP